MLPPHDGQELANSQGQKLGNVDSNKLAHFYKSCDGRSWNRLANNKKRTLTRQTAEGGQVSACRGTTGSCLSSCQHSQERHVCDRTCESYGRVPPSCKVLEVECRRCEGEGRRVACHASIDHMPRKSALLAHVHCLSAGLQCPPTVPSRELTAENGEPLRRMGR